MWTCARLMQLKNPLTICTWRYVPSSSSLLDVLLHCLQSLSSGCHMFSCEARFFCTLLQLDTERYRCAPDLLSRLIVEWEGLQEMDYGLWVASLQRHTRLRLSSESVNLPPIPPSPSPRPLPSLPPPPLPSLPLVYVYTLLLLFSSACTDRRRGGHSCLSAARWVAWRRDIP